MNRTESEQYERTGQLPDWVVTELRSDESKSDVEPSEHVRESVHNNSQVNSSDDDDDDESVDNNLEFEVINLQELWEFFFSSYGDEGYWSSNESDDDS